MRVCVARGGLRLLLAVTQVTALRMSQLLHSCLRKLPSAYAKIKLNTLRHQQGEYKHES